MKSNANTLYFSELLLVLLKGKINIVDALHILSGEGMEKQVKNSAKSLLILMKKGRSLSQSIGSLDNSGIFFEPMYLTLISAAELVGNIDAVLERIVNDLRRKEKAKEAAINILIYPSIIVLLAICGTLILIVKGIPLFASGGLLPESTVEDTLGGICAAGSVLLSGGAALFYFYYRIFYIDSHGSRIFYLLDFLLRSNVTLPDALSHCVTSLSKTKYGSKLLAVKKDIAQGVSFSNAFIKTKLFSPYISGWLSIADNGGNTGEICGNIAKYFAEKDNKKRELAAKLIEPAIIVLTGLYILIIMTTVILPILTFAGGSI